MSKPGISFFLFCMLSVCLFAFQVEAAQGDATAVVQAEGVAVIAERDVASARTLAIETALRGAVRDVVEASLSDYQASARRDRIEGELYEKWRDYIQDFRLLEEGVLDNRYQVTLSATVLTGKIKDFFKGLDSSRIAVVVVDGGMQRYAAVHGKVSVVSACEAALRSFVEAEGFVAVGPPEYVQASEGPDISPERAAYLGRIADAKMVIAGSLQVLPRAPTDENREMFRLFLVLEAVRVRDEMPIATSAAEILVAGDAEPAALNEKISAVATEAAGPLVGEIGRALAQPATGDAAFLLTVRGVGSCAEYVALRNYLKNAKSHIAWAVERVFERGVVRFEVKPVGSMDALAQALEAARVGKLRLIVRDLSVDGIVTEVLRY